MYFIASVVFLILAGVREESMLFAVAGLFAIADAINSGFRKEK